MVQVTSYLTKKFAELNSPNKFKVYMGHGGKPWVSDFNHPHYMAGRKALKTGQTSSLGTQARSLSIGLCRVVWSCSCISDTLRRVDVQAGQHHQPASRVGLLCSGLAQGLHSVLLSSGSI